jgi:hypothetical protein
MQSLEDYIVNGAWHKCVCGEPWSDSDGGPCHEECEKCEECYESGEDHECKNIGV